jgi:hypothetical protein
MARPLKANWRTDSQSIPLVCRLLTPVLNAPRW